MHITYRLLLVLILLWILPTQAQSQNNPASNNQTHQYQITVLAEQLHFPWSLAFLPEGGFLITEKSGQIKHLDQEGKLVATLVVELPGLFSAAQGGLLELALAPDFEQSRQLFLSYACGTRTANSLCLASARLAENKSADNTPTNSALIDVKQIFRARPDRKAPAHFGGRIAFLPDDTLVLTLGDGFDYREEAQNPANHLGKIVRLNLDGSVPKDNPFIDRANYAPEIFSLGHRNVQGIVYDAASNTLFSHEHGPRGGDELNQIVAGQNYGWPVATQGIDYTGARISPYTEFSGMIAPLHGWTPSIAPAGMALYQGDLFPRWHGNIFVAALAAKRLYRLEMKGNEVIHEEVMLAELDLRLRDVRGGPDGALYLLTDSEEGQLLRLTPAD